MQIIILEGCKSKLIQYIYSGDDVQNGTEITNSGVANKNLSGLNNCRAFERKHWFQKKKITVDPRKFWFLKFCLLREVEGKSVRQKRRWFNCFFTFEKGIFEDLYQKKRAITVQKRNHNWNSSPFSKTIDPLESIIVWNQPANMKYKTAQTMAWPFL